jgi:hypothetical protein
VAQIPAVHGSILVRLGIVTLEEMLVISLPCVLALAASLVRTRVGVLSPGVRIRHFHCRPLSLWWNLGLQYSLLGLSMSHFGDRANGWV